MAGVAITVEGPGAPQGGNNVILCSVPASLTAFGSLSATGPGSVFVQVTKVPDINGNSEVTDININKIISVIGT